MDKELIKKLNNLRNITPDSGWKKSYREILYSQISLGLPANQAKSNFEIILDNLAPRKILIDLAKPVWLASLASALILAVGLGGVYAAKNTKPGDSLYIAKIISEKAQLAMAFNEKDKAKLGVEFAANRTKEITQILQQASQADKNNENKLAELSQNFKKEISQVKSRLTVIKAAGKSPASQNNNDKDDDFKVFGADSGKNNQRLEIAEPDQPALSQTANGGEAATSGPIIENKNGVNATTTAEKAGQADQILDEAEKLFDEKNYNGTIDKLEQAKQAINQTETGQVKGESETAATSTEEKQ